MPTLRSNLVVVLLSAATAVSTACAETHRLFDRGRTLVEAEEYSRVSESPPQIRASERCSGKSNLEYFWANAWFELTLDVVRLLHYDVSLRVASEKGTVIEVQSVSEGNVTTKLTTIKIPSTGSYTAYKTIRGGLIAIPAGTQTLRFRNVSEGVNVDFVSLTAGSHLDIASHSFPAGAATNAKHSEDRVRLRAVRHLVAIDDSERTHVEVDLAEHETDLRSELAVLEMQDNKLAKLHKFQAKHRRHASGHNVTISGTCDAQLNPDADHWIGLRMLPSERESQETNALSSQDDPSSAIRLLPLAKGGFRAGWNLLDPVEHRKPRTALATEDHAFPFRGSFRPSQPKSDWQALR